MTIGSGAAESPAIVNTGPTPQRPRLRRQPLDARAPTGGDQHRIDRELAAVARCVHCAWMVTSGRLSSW